MKAPSIAASVIIPAYNAADTLPACIDALLHQSTPRSEYEIIVVDDGSTDDTAARVPTCENVRLIRSSHSGAAAARNTGVRAARGPVLLFTDADCEPSENWIREMLAPFADAEIVGAKGTYRTRQREWVARFVQYEYEEKYARMAGAPSIDFVDTYSAGYRRTVFLDHGGFDESFPTASVEDQEFSFRLTSRGARLVFVPNAIVSHRHAASLAKYVRRKFWIGFYKVGVHRRHPDKVWRDSHTPPTLKFQVLLILGFATALLAVPVVPLAAQLAVLLGAMLAVSALPLTWFVARRDLALAPLAPMAIILRAAALALGLVTGLCAGVWVSSRPVKLPSSRSGSKESV